METGFCCQRELLIFVVRLVFATGLVFAAGIVVVVRIVVVGLVVVFELEWLDWWFSKCGKCCASSCTSC